MDNAEIAWKFAGGLAAALAAYVARNALEAGWRATRGAEPPANPTSPDTDWPEAVAWAALTGVLVGVARLIATRYAAERWRQATGELPPGMETVT